MRKVETALAGQELQGILRTLRDEPVSIVSGSSTMAVVLSPQAYSDLLARCVGGRRPGGRRALTTNANDLYGFDADVFCTEGP